MTPAELLVDGFTRIREGVHAAVEGLGPDRLSQQPAKGSNSIGWLVWHLARVQDDHVAEVAGLDQVWTSGPWREHFGLPFDPAETGYGATSEEVALVRDLSADQLTGYLDAVHEQTVAWVKGLAPEDLDRVVDERWDPPVTLGARLVSVVNDDQQHVGQAAYVRGLLT
ncbi:MAG: DinB family protein [Pedococcus sp.]